MEIFKIVVLSLSGLLLVYAGSMRLFRPIKSFCLKTYMENPGLTLEGEVDIFNEMRGAGSSLALSGIIILLGTIMPNFRLASFVIAITVFLGFTIGRLLSSSLDGKPNENLVQGLYSEIILGTLNLICLVTILI